MHVIDSPILFPESLYANTAGLKTGSIVHMQEGHM